MSIKVQGQVVISDDKKGLFDQVNPGVYTTAERDALSPAVGDIVYNSQDEELQVWDGTDWGSAGSGSGSIGSPVEVLTPLDGAGVSGSYNYLAQTDVITSVDEEFNYGTLTNSDFGFSNSHDGRFRVVEGNDDRIVAINGKTGPNCISYSDDGGLTWTSVPTQLDNCNDIVFNGTNYIIACYDGILYSSDGASWSQPSIPNGINALYSIAFNPSNGRVVASGSTNISITSSSPRIYSDNNGASWNYCNNASGNEDSGGNRYNIVYGNGRFVSPPTYSYNHNSGTNRTYSEYSTDGINWYVGDSSSDSLNGTNITFDYDNNLFVAIGKSHWAVSGPDYYRTYIGWSSNGASWTVHQLDAKSYSDNDYYYHHRPVNIDGNALMYLNGVFLIGREGNPYGHTYMYSTDMVNWTNISFGGGYFYGGSVLRNKFWMATSDYVYVSSEVSQDSTPSFQSSSTANKTIKTYTFASSNVYNAADNSIVDGANFVDVFDRTLKWSVAGGGTDYNFNPSEVTDGVIKSETSTVFQTGNYLNTSSELTVYGPSPSEIVFTSQNAGTTPVSATDATVAFRKWTLETRASSLDPWTLVTTSDDYDIVASQDGATPWSSKPTLTADTQYRVKVEYSSNNARSVESEYNYFTTGPS